jgi:uncharacterized protein YbbC (DUF1343 family)/CubicO group peptidase (beta-lactamase class C family)
MIAVAMLRRSHSWRRSIVLLSLAAATLAGGFTASLAASSGDGAAPDVALTPDEDSLRGDRVAAKFHVRVLAEMGQAIDQAIADGRIPGGVLWIEHEGVPFESLHGHRSLIPTREEMTRDTIFDIASLTKVVATTPAVLKLVEQGRIRLADAVHQFIPEFEGDGKEKITIRQLLTHTSGLRPGFSTQPAWSGADTAIRMASTEKVQQTPGTAFRYSDINFVLVAEVVRRVSGRSIEEFVETEIYRPLKMIDTGFLPHPSDRARIAPTGTVNGKVLRGTVHDPTARFMGGVAGHAGLFSTIDDLARFCRMLLNDGELDGVRVLAPDTIRLMTSVQTPQAIAERRGLGWDIDSAYSRPRGQYFPIGSFGHTGFTGASLWVDPFSRTFWIFISNRVHPDGRGNVLPLQAELADLAALAVKDFDFTAVEGALPPRGLKKPRSPAAKTDVSSGIDVLKRDDFAALRGSRLGLITNHTGRDRDGTPTIDLLQRSKNVQLVALFSPEHGIRGELDATVDDAVDAGTGLPIYSLYGERRSPSPEQLDGIDALVFDIQDIGCRFYTYISTMGHAMQAAAASRVKFIVLDRPNPITGAIVQGPMLDGKTDFVGWHAMPVRHGMTVGELARLFNEEKHLGVDLQVIPLSGWAREMWLDETTVPWVDTSPNMRSLTQAALYPGVGLLETTHLSVGRGTDTPFELFGAPYIDGELLAERMNAFGIHGVRFDPVAFTPGASKFKDQRCEGVRITLIDRDHCDVVNIGIAGALVLNELYAEEFGLDRFNGLLKSPETMAAIREDRPLTAIRKLWAPRLSGFEASRRRALLY